MDPTGCLEQGQNFGSTVSYEETIRNLYVRGGDPPQKKHMLQGPKKMLHRHGEVYVTFFNAFTYGSTWLYISCYSLFICLRFFSFRQTLGRPEDT